jgi:hypothetical protein
MESDVEAIDPFKTMNDSAFAKAALAKMAPTPDGFKIYAAGWLGKRPADFKAMRVTGASFRAAQKGPRKGVACIMIKGTTRSVKVTREEISAFE